MLKACGLAIPNAPPTDTCARRHGHSGQCRGIGPNDSVYVHFFERPPSPGETDGTPAHPQSTMAGR
jgi:hypothetical protein